jgi:hypothetical protein
MITLVVIVATIALVAILATGWWERTTPAEAPTPVAPEAFDAEADRYHGSRQWGR